MKKSTIMFTAVAFLLFGITTVFGQPSWTDFSYIDWNPGADPAIAGSSGNRHYECRTMWDGSRFVNTHEQDRGPSDYSLWISYSTDGQGYSGAWSTPLAIDVPRSWDIGHHAMVGDANNFPPTDVAWTDQSQNVKFKMWYAAYGDNYHYRYSESTDGLYWHPFVEYDYCPPDYKVSDFNPGQCGTTKNMIKPDVLYMPDNPSSLDTASPMNNRYVCYLGSNHLFYCSGNPGYFEMYISSNGLDWKLYAWDDQCQARWETYTSDPSEVSEFITFTGCSNASSNQYPNDIEEVYQNGEVQGYMLWTDNYTSPIYSFYSTNGFDWICREDPINTIGSCTTGIGWNSSRNYNFDSLRLGESYFITRSGSYNTGCAIVKGKMSAEVTTPDSPAGGDVNIDYLLYQWNSETCTTAAFTFSTDGSTFVGASMGAGGDGATNLSTGIGGSSHSYVWDSLSDLPGGATDVLFRVQPTGPETGSYDTTGTFDVEQAATATPTMTPTATATATPTPSPTKTPTATPTASATATPTPTATASATPTSSATPTATPTSSPSPTPTCGPSVPLNKMVIESGDYDGDGTDDIAIFRGSSSLWAVRGVTRVYFGTGTDRPAAGNYIGDGVTRIAVFRPSSSLWAVRNITRIYFGSATDLPIPGDYDGDGTADIAAFRDSTGLWAVRDMTRTYFGGVGDWPIPADYSGDGTHSIAVRRPASGLWALKDTTRVYYGNATDWPRPADYDGDFDADIAVFRLATGLWAVRDVTRVYFGCCLDWPVPADFDGDNTDDISLFRGSSGLWAVRDVTRTYYGTSGDIPVIK